jgi:hypothetical protein
MAMNFWKSLPRREGAPVRLALPLSKEQEQQVAEILNSSVGNPFFPEAEAYVNQLRIGKLLANPIVEDVLLSARSLAERLLTANLLNLGLKMLPEPRQTLLLYDPPQGAGAGIKPVVLNITMGEREQDEAEALLLGSVTCYGSPLWHRLRSVILLPCELRQDDTTLKGDISAFYGTVTEDGLVALHRIVQPVLYCAGTFHKLPRIDDAELDRSTSDLIRAAFVVNDASMRSCAHLRKRRGTAA